MGGGGSINLTMIHESSKWLSENIGYDVQYWDGLKKELNLKFNRPDPFTTQTKFAEFTNHDIGFGRGTRPGKGAFHSSFLRKISILDRFQVYRTTLTHFLPKKPHNSIPFLCNSTPMDNAQIVVYQLLTGIRYTSGATGK